MGTCTANPDVVGSDAKGFQSKEEFALRFDMAFKNEFLPATPSLFASHCA